MSNLKQQGLGILMYIQDYDERFPTGENWMDKINPYVRGETFLHCPSLVRSPAEYGYAYHSDMSGKLMRDVAAPNSTMMLFDSSTLTRSASDAGTSLPNPPRHRHNNIGYADGHVNSDQPAAGSGL